GLFLLILLSLSPWLSYFVLDPFRRVRNIHGGNKYKALFYHFANHVNWNLSFHHSEDQHPISLGILFNNLAVRQQHLHNIGWCDSVLLPFCEGVAIKIEISVLNSLLDLCDGYPSMPFRHFATLYYAAQRSHHSLR